MTRFAATVAVLFLLSSGRAEAQFFTDNFEDGSATDGVPVTWVANQPVAGEGRQVQDDSYVLTPAAGTFVIADGPENRTFGDVSLRSQFRYLGTPDSFSAIGLAARGNGVTIGNDFFYSGYWASITTNGTLQIGRTVSADVQVLREVRFAPIPINTDVHMQFDLFGNTLSLTAWQEGISQPVTPQLTLIDSSFSDGEVGMWLQASNNLVPGAFRFFAAVPEPSTLLLASFGLVSMLGYVRRR